jgi:hypothetical protein
VYALLTTSSRWQVLEVSFPPRDPRLLIVGGVFVFALLLIMGRVLSRWRLQRWCRKSGYELVDWRGAKFYEGPFAWFRSENQDAYQMEVRDRQGLTRVGYIVFGSFWLPWSRKVHVEWD